MQTSQTSTAEVSRDVDRGLRLSYQQGRIWPFVQAEETGIFLGVVPTVQCGLRIDGELDVTHLRASLQRAVDRHEILRTNFVRAGESGEPVQFAVPTGSIAWRSIDLSDCDAEERTRRVQDHRAEDSLEPFALGDHPVLRASLLAFAPDEYILILTLPALCADAASMQTLVSEVSGWYVHGHLLQQDEDVIQYSSISEWQRALHEEEDAVQGRKYWNAQPVPAPIVFTLQRAQRAASVFSPTSCAVPLPSQTQSRLRAIQREDVFLLGCWLALLRSISGQSTLGVGITCHGRDYEELQGVIGPLARVVPVSCTVRKDMRFNGLLQTLTEAVDLTGDWQEFYEHRAGEKSHEAVAFEFSEWPAMVSSNSNIRFTLAFEHFWSEPFHIKLALTRSGDELHARLDFDPDVFDPLYIASLCDQLATLIDGAAKNTDSPVEQLPILSDKERRFLLEACNDTRADYPRNALLHQLIAEQAARTPHRIAVTFEDAHLTYEDLDQRSNQLAHKLQQMHVGPEVRVGIYMHRSLEMMIAILAVVKAGGAYVPLEPAYPVERLSFMLQDAQVAMILTQDRLHARLPQTDAEVLCVDEPMDVLCGGQPVCRPESGACSDNLVYVLYTSGSTGRPKGAMISHRNLLNYLVWCLRAYSVESGTGTPVHSSIGFDATITALFPPLLVGRTVMLLPESEGVDAIPRALEQADAFSLMKITPAHMSLLNELIDGNQLASKAKMLVIGGDALSGSRLSVWRRHAPQTRFINEYGPTETVVGCCVHEAVEADFARESVPIGRPIANTRLYVLDRWLNPLPVGIPGELFINGDGVCRGYLGRPMTTAERFLPDRFSGTAGSRMYRTGDLVVQQADGVLWFLGRLDHQVKIRSYRIELGEIEAQLELHPAVSQTVVVARMLAGGDKSLAAYVQCSGPMPPNGDELRAFLLEKLPEYMVPSAFVILNKLPLTAHGKVNRDALPDPAAVPRTALQQYVAPRTPVEMTLALIWQQVLKLDSIGIHDDFFRSGGDSIQSILIVARGAKAGLRFNTRDLFHNPTIAGLAAVAKNNGTAIRPSCEAQGTVPLTPIQRWFFEQDLSNPNHFNQSVLLDVRADLKMEWVGRVLEELVSRHDALRLRFMRQPEGWLQKYSAPEGTVIIEETDLDILPPDERQNALDSSIGKAQSSLNVSTGPMMRAVLFRAGRGIPGKLLLTIHHLVIDGVSWRILLDDFATAYQQLADNQPIQLPPPTDSFKSWSTRLHDYASTDSASAEAEYWLKRHTSIGQIPVDFAVSPDKNTVAASANVKLTLGSQLTSTLLHGVSDVYRTHVDDLLLTALAQALTHWNSSPANLIDCEGHGRDDLFRDTDVSRTIGWFTSIYPMCLDLTGTEGLGEQLETIKEQRRQVPRKGVGYGVLRYLSRDPELRDRLAALPRPEVSFNYLGTIDEVCAEPIVGLASVALDGEQDPMGRRAYLLDVIMYVQNGSLHMQIVYGTALHKQATIERLTHDIRSCIESLVDHCLSTAAGGFTHSDFLDVELSQTELDELEAELE